ncbi:MAG: dienelactone hydrolase family protein [Anaerolineales bacterium]|nr:dienelactone hydrolase family protein [Anaerolineales bacterium]
MNTFQRYLVDEFAEDYQERRLTRRDALKLIASVTGSLLVAESILAACAPAPLAESKATQLTTSIPEATQPQATQEPVVAPTEPGDATVSPSGASIEAGPVEFSGDGATLLGYLARPSGDGSKPVILVCHENRGLTPHIEDVTRRLAMAGYVALAVDLLSRQGGSPQVGESNVPGALGNIDPSQFVSDFRSGWAYLGEQPFADAERVGMVGFCFGGGVTWLMAVEMPELKAAVPFYGPPPPEEDLPRIQAAVLAIYGELDGRITGTAERIEAAMLANGKVFEKEIYPNADHAFHNDTSTRYNAEAATAAWARTLDWFGRYV